MAQHGSQKGPPPIPTEAQIEKMVQELSTTLALTQEQEKMMKDKFNTHFQEVEQIQKNKGDAGRPDRKQMEKRSWFLKP